MFISIQQIKAARGLLDWTQEDLANHAGLNMDQIRKFESGKTRSLDVLEAIFKTLTAQGLAFVDEGVIRRKYEIRVLRGQQGFWDFNDEVYETIRAHGGDIFVHNVDESLFLKWGGEDFWRRHSERMSKLGAFGHKIIICEGDMNFIADFSTTEYRWADRKEFTPNPFYLYGEKLAMLMFEKDDISIFIIDQPKITESYRVLFMGAWDRAKIPPHVKSGPNK